MLDEENKSIVYVFSQLGELEDIVAEEFVIRGQDTADKIIDAYNIYYLDASGGQIYGTDYRE